MIRMPRFMVARNVNADSAKVGLILPIYTHEVLQKLYIDVKCMTRGTGLGGVVGTPTSYSDQYNEINWHILYVPFSVWSTNMNAQRTGYAPPRNEDDLDQLFRRLLFEWEANGNEYYGGDYDGDPLTFNREDDTEGGSATESTDEPNDSVAERGSFGPTGIVRLLGREVWMQNMVSDGDGKARQGDEFMVDLPMMLPGPGYILGGAVRYEHATQDNFNVTDISAAQVPAEAMLLGGDMMRVQAHIEKDSTVMGDWMRTILFGGDAYIDDDTVKGEAAKMYWKGVATIQTPYRIMRF